MTAKQSEERPENVNTGNWRQLVRDVVDENPEVFIPNDKPTAMNTQSPQTTLSEERLRAQFEEWANREMKGGIRRLESGKYALDSINGAWIAWRHAAEQMARYQWQPIESAPRDGKFLILAEHGDATLPWPAYATDGKIISNAHGPVNDQTDRYSIKATHWMPLPPAPEKGGQAHE